MQLISRDDARAKGLRFFFTSRPCARGHVAQRYVSSYACVMCEQRPEKKAAVKSYGESNRAERNNYFREWRRLNRERANAYGCAWAKRNPEEHAARSRLRRARIRGGEGNHSAEQVVQILAKQKFKCANCKKSVKRRFEADHVTPISRGGSNDISNIQVLCVSCNRRKNAKDPIVWAQENGRLL